MSGKLAEALVRAGVNAADAYDVEEELGLRKDGSVNLTATTSSDGGIRSPWDVQEISTSGHVVYSALPRLNRHLPADGRTYSISAYPTLARRLGRISNGLSAAVLRTSAADNLWGGVCWSPELSLFVAVASSGTGNRVMSLYGCMYNPLTDFAVPKITPPAGCYAHIFAG